MSHPTRVRGLKSSMALNVHTLWFVAPHTGAWIEIGLASAGFFSNSSHPTRVRGLKFIDEAHHSKANSSHPTRVRGLKFIILPSVTIVVCRTPHGCVD